MASELADPLSIPYPLSRVPVYGRRGAVASSQPLAAQAGLWALQSGGNAIDAAIATAAALTVVEPTSNGLGSDAFALVWAGGQLYGLNASGVAPAALDVGAVRAHGHDAMPRLGWLPVTVPGAISAWAALHERFGRLPFTEVLAPAIALADGGFSVSPVVARYWRFALRDYERTANGAEFAGWFSTFSPDGSSPVPGDVVRLPDHAATLRSIAASGGRSFYEGDIAQRIDAFSRSTGGLLRADDLAAHQCEWVEPIGTSYRDHEVWEIPPNGHGITALMALNVLEGFSLAECDLDDPWAWHVQIESMKLAFSDAFTYVADPRVVDVNVRGLLDKTYAAGRRDLIGDEAGDPAPGNPPTGGTVYLCTADGEGNMVSYIQSNYDGFGSGIVVPGTGVALQNRGNNFTLDESHPNVLRPGKRPYHTIIPGFLTRGGEAVGPFGVMGGFMQPQGHLQVVVRTVDQQMHPQAALDAPRWRWDTGRTVWLEHRVPSAVVEGLRARGHDVRVIKEPSGFGRGQIIWRTGQSLVAGSESRADGQAVVW
jgi:gamma-glutamyltranspeptidase/glutathione hydrolase